MDPCRLRPRLRKLLHVRCGFLDQAAAVYQSAQLGFDKELCCWSIFSRSNASPVHLQRLPEHLRFAKTTLQNLPGSCRGDIRRCRQPPTQRNLDAEFRGQKVCWGAAFSSLDRVDRDAVPKYFPPGHCILGRLVQY